MPFTLDNNAEDLSPEWSPDGTRIVYMSHLFNAPGLFVMNADGSNMTRLTDSYNDTTPTWSPDGTRIAFNGNRNNEPFGIYLVNSDGTQLRGLAAGGSPSWSPDGARIAFFGNQGFSIMFADGSGVRTVPTPGLFQGMQFNWSPDGNKIVFTGVEFGNQGNNIYTINSDGSGMAKVPNTTGGQSASYSPDGTKILFSSYAPVGINGGINTINLDGSGLTKISGDLTEIGSASWQTRPPNFVPLPPTYNISGRLISSVSGDSVSGGVQVSGTANRFASTNNSGDYKVRGLPASGNYLATPQIFGNPPSTPANRSYTNLSSDQTGADFSITFSEQVPVSGHVVDNTGAPLSNVRVGMGNSIPNGANAFTSLSGFFTFAPNVFPGFQAFLIPFPENNYANYVFDPGVKSIQTRTGNDFVGRPRTASISGQVTVGGVGKPGILISTGSPQQLTITSDANGNYTLSGVGEGVTIEVNVDTSVYPFTPSAKTVTVNGQKTGVNFAAPANQFLISGRITDPSSSGISGVTMTLSGGASGTTQTDSQGKFSFGLEPANAAYTISAAKTGYSITPAAASITNLTSNSQLLYTGYLNTAYVYATSLNVVADEGAGSASITVVRTGYLADPLKIDFGTSDGTASQRTDYTSLTGTLTFAPQEQSKTIVIPINDDAYVEGDETFTVTLSNPVGGLVGSTSTAVVTIRDDDTAVPSLNPINNGSFFARQHYLDFLSRVPDSSGLTYWTEQVTDCGIDMACINSKRSDVSNAFFYELEYQQTGSYVYRLYRAAFGNDQPFPNSIPDPTHPGEEKKVVAYQAFAADRSRVVGGANLVQAQLELAQAFVQRPEFLSKYPANLDGPGFVDAIVATIMNDIGADLMGQRQGLINLFNSGGRGAVLYRLADDNTQTNPINNRSFIDAEYNRAFVATQYFGYLRRDPDMGGFLFWLGQVSSAPLRNVPKQHAMVCSFITSAEYQQRFSSVFTHTNSECQ